MWGAEDEVAQQLTEEAVEGAAGGVEVDIEGDEVTVTDGNGDSAGIGTSLPRGLPLRRRATAGRDHRLGDRVTVG